MGPFDLKLLASTANLRFSHFDRYTEVANHRFISPFSSSKQNFSPS